MAGSHLQRKQQTQVSILRKLEQPLECSRHPRSEGELIALEFVNHVAIPLRWKECLYHAGSSFTVNSTRAGLIAGGKDTEDGRHTVFTPQDPVGDDTEEDADLTKPRKVHFKNLWKISLDAVYIWSIWKSTTWRLTVLADPITRHHPLWLSVSWLPWTSGKPQKRQKICTRGFLLHDGLRKSCWRMLDMWSATNNHAASNRERRETSSKLISVCTEYHKMQYSKIKGEWPRFETWWKRSERNTGQSKTGGIQQIQWGIHKDHPKVGKDRISWIGKGFNENTVRVLRQVLARRTGLLLLRTLSKAYERVEAKDKGTISRLVKFLLHSEEELFARCKAWTNQRAVRSH